MEQTKGSSFCAATQANGGTPQNAEPRLASWRKEHVDGSLSEANSEIDVEVRRTPSQDPQVYQVADTFPQGRKTQQRLEA